MCRQRVLARGSRIAETKKQGTPIIGHTLDALLSHPLIDNVYVAIKAGDTEWLNTDYVDHPQITTVTGGATVHSLCLMGCWLSVNMQPDDWVMVHDAVRPWLTQQLIDKLLTTLQGMVGVARCAGS